MYVKCNNEARQLKHCCRGKICSVHILIVCVCVYICVCVCVCVCSLIYAARPALVPYYIVTCGLTICCIFFRII